MIIYRALHDMVLDGKITQEKYILGMSEEIVNESDLSAFNFLVSSIRSIVFSYFFNAESTYEYSHIIFSALKSKILSRLDGEFENVALSHLIDFLFHKDDVYEAIDWVRDSKSAFNEIDISNGHKLGC